MKKILSAFVFAVLALSAVMGVKALAASVLDNWDKPEAPYVSTIGGSRLKGFKANIGLNGTPGNTGTISNAYVCDVNAWNGEVVVLTTNTTNPLSVSETTTVDVASNTVVGVIVTAPGAVSSTSAAGRVDVAIDGVVAVKVVPLAVTKMALLGTCAVAGQLSITAAGTTGWYMQALETKTTTATDPLVRCRFIKRY